jgi:hypothetical protein
MVEWVTVTSDSLAVQVEMVESKPAFATRLDGLCDVHLHAPLLHCPGHARSHAPQFMGSLEVSIHRPSAHLVRLHTQLAGVVAVVHVYPGSHVVPVVGQEPLESQVTTMFPLHLTSLGLHWPVQALLRQT